MGRRAIRLIVPAIEELCKTGGAWLLGKSIIPVHILFGAMEGAFDGLRGPVGGRARLAFLGMRLLAP